MANSAISNAKVELTAGKSKRQSERNIIDAAQYDISYISPRVRSVDPKAVSCEYPLLAAINSVPRLRHADSIPNYQFSRVLFDVYRVSRNMIDIERRYYYEYNYAANEENAVRFRNNSGDEKNNIERWAAYPNISLNYYNSNFMPANMPHKYDDNLLNAFRLTSRASGVTLRASEGTSRASGGTSSASGVTSRPTGVTSRASEGTLRTSEGTSRASEGTLRASGGTSRPTEGTLRASEGTLRASEGTLRASEGTLRTSEGTSRASGLTSRASEGTLRTSEGTSRASGVNSRASGVTSRASGVTSRTSGGTLRASEGISRTSGGFSLESEFVNLYLQLAIVVNAFASLYGVAAMERIDLLNICNEECLCSGRFTGQDLESCFAIGLGVFPNMYVVGIAASRGIAEDINKDGRSRGMLNQNRIAMGRQYLYNQITERRCDWM